MAALEEMEKDLYDDDDNGEDHNHIIKGSDLIFNPQSRLRNWLKSRGKGDCIDFDDQELM